MAEDEEPHISTAHAPSRNADRQARLSRAYKSIMSAAADCRAAIWVAKGVKILDPHLADLTPAHMALYWRYQVVRTLVDFGAAMCFVIGSAFFFFASMATGADWLFLFGSILFALKPTIDVIRSAHLKRLPGQSHGPAHHSPVRTGDDS